MSEEKAALPEKDDAEFATPRRARPGRALSAFAIILALAAAAGCAYVYWLVTQQQSTTDISALEDQIRETRSQLQNARQAFDEQAAAPSPLQASLTQIEESVATLKRRLEQYESQQRSGTEQLNAIEPELAELAQQVQSLNRSVLGLASAESRTETDLVLREVAYLLRRAAMKLQLDDDKPAALAAYDQADHLLRDLDDAMSAGLRESILTERTTIAAIQPLDRVRITTQLQQLAQSTYDWPLKSTASMATEPPEKTADTENDSGFWDSVSGFF